jgi:hypothetical protein
LRLTARRNLYTIRLKQEYIPASPTASFDLIVFGGTRDLGWRKLLPMLVQAWRWVALRRPAAELRPTLQEIKKNLRLRRYVASDD